MRAIKSRGLYIFNPFSTAVYIIEWLELQTIHVLNKIFFSIFGPKICGLYYQEVSIIRLGRSWLLEFEKKIVLVV